MWITGQGALRVDNGLERFVFLAGTEGFRVRLFGGRALPRRFAPCVLCWKTLSRFLSFAPLRVRIPPLAHEKALQVHMGLERYVLRGWDGGIRTPNSRHQKPEFYR